jgi:ribose 5-phosphate isomerase B
MCIVNYYKNQMDQKKITIFLASDHGGFQLKSQLNEHLNKNSEYLVIDTGCHEEKRCDYPDIAKTLCKTMYIADMDNNKNTNIGIICCGTGIGVSIVCNRNPDIRCALCHDHYTSMMARKHNNANVLALGGRTIGIEVAKEIVDTFIQTPFEAGRHLERVNKFN